MAAANLLDDPDHINAFLSMIGASPIVSRVARTTENEEDEELPSNEQAKTDDKENKNPTTTCFGLNKKEMTGTVTPEVRSRAHSTTSSPVVGIKAPPPTPVSTAATTEPAAKLKPINEDETDALVKLADESKLGLNESKFAHKLRYPVAEYKPDGPSTSVHQCPAGTIETTSHFIPKIKNDMITEDPGKGYMDQVVSDLKKKHSSNIKIEDNGLVEQTPPPSIFVREAAPPIKPLGKVSQDLKTAERKGSPDVAATESGIITVPVATAGTDDSGIVEEDREHLTHFKSWGKPQARDGPAARVRRVALSSLPEDTDLTLVQSLVHGGAIDDMVLMGASGVAYVRFTSGDTCDTYCNQYPNGLVFKYRGRSHTVFVDKCKDIDIVSGMLQGYIDCGASRCVRAIGADEDWAMRALKKLAEGKSRKGKVESITDVYRNGIRTIVFRFSSIAEAVSFKGMLVRDEAWEACNIQFATDPCEKATGVHLE